MDFYKIIRYCFIGALTTSINFIMDMGLRYFGIPYFLSISVAWLTSITFAFICNKTFVFKNKDGKLSSLLFKFFNTRIGVLFLELILTYVFIELCSFNKYFVKVSLQILIVVLNYFLGKHIFENEVTT